MKTAQDFAREAVERGIISKANESELELHMLHYMEELLKHWNVANKNCVQPDVSGQFCDCIKEDWDGADVNGNCVHCGRKHK